MPILRSKKDNKFIKNNNIKVRKKKKEKRNLRSCLEKDIFEFLLNEINDHETNSDALYNITLLNVLLYYTGLRVSEVLILNKIDILSLYNRGKLDVYCKKTKDHRTVFLQGLHKEKFTKHLNGLDLNAMNKFGISGRYGNKVNQRTVNYWMEYYWDKLEETYGGRVAGLKGRPWGFHSYRVNFINQIVRSGDLDKASKVIGHKNPCTTLIYFRKLKNKEEDTVNMINNASF